MHNGVESLVSVLKVISYLCGAKGAKQKSKCVKSSCLPLDTFDGGSSQKARRYLDPRILVSLAEFIKVCKYYVA